MNEMTLLFLGVYGRHCDNLYGSKNLTSAEPEVVKCECGALKTYGSTASSLHHAIWCPMRERIEI